MLLSSLLKKIEYLECLNFKECEISSVTENTASVKRGYVFVCVSGKRVDGNTLADEAQIKGACVFVSDSQKCKLSSKTTIFVKNARKCEAEIAKALCAEKIENMKIIGITGTKGKTTTAKFLAECASYLGIKCVCIGTLGIEYYDGGKCVFEGARGENTTPDSSFIYKALSDAYDNGARVAVIEVSSQALISFRVYGIPFTVCIFTNFSRDHIGESEHNSVYEYLGAKRKLFSDYGAKICIVNSDDSSADFISHGIRYIIKIGSKSKEYKLEVISSNEQQTRFNINEEEFFISIGGVYNVTNAALAIVAASLVFGRDLSEFKEAVKAVSVRGRYELYTLGEKRIIIDFAHNAESLKSVAESAKAHTKGRLIILFGSVGDRSYSRRGELACTAEKFADFIIITSDNPGFESSDCICRDILDKIKDKSLATVIVDREAAIKHAINIANDGDTILLLGKGHEEFQYANGKKIPFSERKIIESLGAVRIN